MVRGTFRRISIIMIIAALAAFIAGFLLAWYQSTTSSKGPIIISNTVTVIVKPRLVHIEVSPMAFPVVGQSWKIFVYSTNQTSDNVYYTPQPNASITVDAKNGNQAKTYFLNVDENGQAEFQFISEYSDIAFKATYGGNESETIVISEHYVSSDIVDTLLLANGLVMSPLSGIGTVLSFRRKRVKRAFSLILTGVFLLFIFIMASSIYSKLFLGTIWGYPENIFGFISLAFLSYATIVGVVIFCIFTSLAFVIQQRSRVDNTKIKENK
jgi:hypothetical protein